MKKILIILLLLVLSGGGAYWYFNVFQQPKLTAWSFIPADAAFVYESTNPLRKWEENKEKKIWKNISTLPSLKNVDKYISTLDSISGQNGSVQSFFEKNEVLFSFHAISKNSMDILFSLKVSNLEQHDLFSKIINHFTKAENLAQDTRQYLGQTITELNSIDGNFAYVFYKNFFIASFTPFLVEDAIRVIEDADVLSFSEQYAELFGIARLEQDQGNIFLNTKKLDQIIGVFTDPVKSDLSNLSTLSEVSFLDLSIDNDNILMTGFSLNNPLKANYLSAFDDVLSSEFEMLEVIPNNTAALIHYSFDDAEKWHSGLKNYWRKTNPALLTKIGELENKYAVPISDLYDFIDTELGLMVMESVNPDKPDLVACINVSDGNLARGFLESMVKTKGAEDRYDESWSDIPIGHIEIDEVPARLFGPGFSGFESTFYCQVGGFLMLGNNEQVIKQLIDNINSEDTWRKSIKTNNFLDIANREANLSLFVNTPGAWNIISKYLNDKWKGFFNEHALTLKQIEFAAFQFSNVDGKYYTNVALQHPGEIVEHVGASDFEITSEIEFENELITKPFMVRNHDDRSLEMIVEDSLNNVFLVSSKVDTLWKKRIDGKIISPVYQMDYYKNRKLQYLFATDSLIHIIDRTGENVAGYPYGLPDNSKLELLSLIDYDNSRKYRIMGANKNGSYYLFDNGGVNLEGWKPNKLEGKPVINPFHIRVRSRDYMMFMHENGLIHVLNRRGERVSGFPLDLKGKTNNPLFIQKGGNIANTKFTALTNGGEVVEFSLEGKFLKREQIFKSTTGDKFKLVASSPSKKTYLIFRSDDEKVTVIDPKGTELFDHNFEVTQLTAKYYNFSPDNQVIVITDVERGYTYLYGPSGRVLHSLPLETGAEIAIQYSSLKGNYKIFKTYRNKLSVVNLKR